MNKIQYNGAAGGPDPKSTCEKGNAECTVYFHRFAQDTLLFLHHNLLQQAQAQP